jgi:hypothetical protein
MPEADDNAYGRFEQACSIEQSYFAAAAETIGTELVIRPCVYLFVCLYITHVASNQKLAQNERPWCP